MSDESLILEGLSRPNLAIAYSVGQELRRRYPELAQLEGSEELFDPRCGVHD